MTEQDVQNRFGTRIALACAVAALCGCAGAGKRREPALPFHVAVIPFSAESGRSVVEGKSRGHGRLALALDAAQVSRAVASSLDGECFTRATLLAPPAGVSIEEFERAPSAERDEHWVRAAQGAGADLLLECELGYSPALRCKRNEKFWMNLPLFLLGGPACYFIDDVSYVGEARLRGNLIDLGAIRGERATLEDGRSRLLHVEARFQEAALDFLDRSGGNVGSFAASIVIPAGMLSHQSRNAERKLAREVAADLARNLARAVAEGSREVLVAERLAGFHLDPRYRIERRGDRVRFQGEAILRRGDVERMESYAIRVGGRSAGGEFDQGLPDRENSTRRARYVRYPFEVEVVADPAEDRAVIELVAGGQNPALRTFTVMLPEGEEADGRSRPKGSIVPSGVR